MTKFQIWSLQKTWNTEKVTNLKTPTQEIGEVIGLRVLTQHAVNPRISKVSTQDTERSPGWMAWLMSQAYHCLSHRSGMGTAVGGMDFAWCGSYIHFASCPPNVRHCHKIKLSVVVSPVPLMSTRESEWDYENSAATKLQLDI